MPCPYGNARLRCDSEEQDAVILRAWGAAVLRPYTIGYAISGGKTLWSSGASPAPTKAKRNDRQGKDAGRMTALPVGGEFFDGGAIVASASLGLGHDEVDEGAEGDAGGAFG